MSGSCMVRYNKANALGRQEADLGQEVFLGQVVILFQFFDPFQDVAL